MPNKKMRFVRVITVVFTLALTLVGAQGMPTVSAQEGREVFYLQSDGLKLTHVAGGAHLAWGNAEAAAQEALFSQAQNTEGVSKVTFDLSVAKNEHTSIEIGFINRYDDRFSYMLTPAQAAAGRRTVEIPMNRLAIVRKDRQIVKSFVQAKERGLLRGSKCESDVHKFQSSGGMLQYDPQAQRRSMHPAYKGKFHRCTRYWA